MKLISVLYPRTFSSSDPMMTAEQSRGLPISVVFRLSRQESGTQGQVSRITRAYHKTQTQISQMLLMVYTAQHGTDAFSFFLLLHPSP